MTTRRRAVIVRGADIIAELVDVEVSSDTCSGRLHHRNQFRNGGDLF
jgi:hypothetical protein